ncbi:hypothetical protein FH972_024464 [Carpinus fangiana]|uniref:Uncharacterized protein n=1 Tax=Carpinus fangiana TaxID=176857 RepID=A0A5N6KY36_9ROSI|nr:hypothetical protein FH972_024464 [Carpinus fangiana]
MGNSHSSQKNHKGKGPAQAPHQGQIHQSVHVEHHTIDPLKAGIPADLNPSHHLRHVNLVWRAIRMLDKAPGLNKVQRLSHWGIEVANHGADDGYIWDLVTDGNGHILVGGRHWEPRHGDTLEMKRSSIDFGTALSDAQIQRLASEALMWLRQSPQATENMYDQWNNNCQQFAGALATLLARADHQHANVNLDKVNKFFKKQPHMQAVGTSIPLVHHNAESGAHQYATAYGKRPPKKY